MCTVSIVNRGDSILVTMNRDERRERSEEGMFSYRKQGVDLLFPRDGLAGGSWIACSERGELACLLNRYDDVEQRERPSRGALVLDVISRDADIPLCDWLLSGSGLGACRYAPFTLLLISHRQSLRLDWDGKISTLTEVPCGNSLASSSSERWHEVLNYREHCFQRWLTRGQPGMEAAGIFMPNVHIEPGEGGPENAILMAREATHSKSITQIELGIDHSEMRYWNEAALTTLEQGEQKPDEAFILLAERRTLRHAASLQHQEVNYA